MKDYRLYESVDEKLRDALAHADSVYDDPYIVIVAHPEVATALKENMNPGSGVDMGSVKINGWDVIESEVIPLAVFICGENLDSKKSREQLRLKKKILGQ